MFGLGWRQRRNYDRTEEGAQQKFFHTVMLARPGRIIKGARLSSLPVRDLGCASALTVQRGDRSGVTPPHREKANVIFECASAGKEAHIVLHLLEQVFWRSNVASQAIDQSVNSEELAISPFGFNNSISEEEHA